MSSALVFLSVRHAKRAWLRAPHAAGLIDGPGARGPSAFCELGLQPKSKWPEHVLPAIRKRNRLWATFCATASRRFDGRQACTRAPYCFKTRVLGVLGGEKAKIIGRNRL